MSISEVLNVQTLGCLNFPHGARSILDNLLVLVGAALTKTLAWVLKHLLLVVNSRARHRGHRGQTADQEKGEKHPVLKCEILKNARCVLASSVVNECNGRSQHNILKT